MFKVEMGKILNWQSNIIGKKILNFRKVVWKDTSNENLSKTKMADTGENIVCCLM